MSQYTVPQISISSEKQRSNLELLSVEQSATIVGCNPVTIRRMISRGELRAYRIGRLIRVKPADLEKALRPVTNAADLRGGDADVA